jgi:hypothetical protein
MTMKLGLMAAALAVLACPVAAGAQMFTEVRPNDRPAPYDKAPLCRDVPRGHKGPCVVTCDNCGPEVVEAIEREIRRQRAAREGGDAGPLKPGRP